MSKEVKLTAKDDCCGGGCCSGQETGVSKPQIVTNNTTGDLYNEVISPFNIPSVHDLNNSTAIDKSLESGYYKVSNKIRRKLVCDGVSFNSNDNISDYLEPGDTEALIDEVAANMEVVLRSLVIDVDNDHNTKESARRIAKMYISEIYSGRYQPKPKITDFPNVRSYDQLYISGPISVRSMCSHHQMPIVGHAFVGVYPGKNVIGLSKFTRIIDHVASRPQIQEEMTQQMADEIEIATQAEGVAIIVKAAHFCMSHRGVKESDSWMTTSVMRGCFLTNDRLKSEFLTLISMK